MNSKGITLIELLVVVAIIGILAVALGFSYVGWQGAYKVEKATKDLYTDLMDARGRAISRGQAYFIDFPTATTYRMSLDDSNGTTKGDGDLIFQPQVLPAVPTPSTDTTVQTFPKTTEYTITWDAGGTITFDRRGIISTPGTICLTTNVDADSDCIEVLQTRINLGKLTIQISAGGACAAANCIAK